MTTLESRCLESFPGWLVSLAQDARALTELLHGEGADSMHRMAVTALTYLFKSLDLIPDGLEDLGFVDDAFVFRVAAARLAPELRAADETGTLERLANDAALIAEFLGPDYARLEAYVEKLGTGSARGRSVEDVVTNPETLAEFVGEVRLWADEYAEPTFTRDEKNLVKLKAFFTTRLGVSVG